VPFSCTLLGDLQSVHGFRCCQNKAPNACILALCLVNILQPKTAFVQYNLIIMYEFIIIIIIVSRALPFLRACSWLDDSSLRR